MLSPSQRSYSDYFRITGIVALSIILQYDIIQYDIDRADMIVHIIIILSCDDIAGSRVSSLSYRITNVLRVYWTKL